MYASSNPMGETEAETCGDNDLLPLFPEDVLIEILVWVPVISLLRFKSVCKSWRALIQSPLFIDLHAATTSRFETFILQVFDAPLLEIDPETGATNDPGDTKMIMVSSEPVYKSGGGGVEDEVFNFYDLGFLFCYTDFKLTRSLRMVGSCNGLICLHDSELRDVFLFNPATRQFRVLPKSITIEEEEGLGIGKLSKFMMEVFVAFGFDVKTKDYKVVHITFLDTTFSYDMKVWACRVQVYSLSTNSWRLLEGINSLPFRPILTQMCLNHGIYLSGSYFFVGRIFLACWDLDAQELDGSILPACNNRVMTSFDFTTEIFTTMQFPDHDSRHKLVLSYLGDKIALFTSLEPRIQYSRPNLDIKDYYEIWVLNEHPGTGSNNNSMNKESWTKLHSFQKRFMSFTDPSFMSFTDPSFMSSTDPSFMSFTDPKCILSDGKLALISAINDDRMYSRLLLFDLVTKEVKAEVIVGEDVLAADVYKETLVSIVGGNGAATADRVVRSAL